MKERESWLCEFVNHPNYIFRVRIQINVNSLSIISGVNFGLMVNYAFELLK